MRTFAQSALTISLAAALLAGCGGSQPPFGAPGAMQEALGLAARTSSSNYKVVYSFGAAPDGYRPVASLIDVGGTLYGTTYFGGEGYAVCGSSGCGTVFSLTPGGREKVVYSFGSLNRGYDGEWPVANLTDVNGTLYGTTFYGGTRGGYGTVFSVTKDGAEKVLHSFIGDLYPAAGLIDVGGTLYGTTESGGYDPSARRGAAFSITTGGEYKQLYGFSGSDGASPRASLIKINGMLYGTTFRGGARSRQGGTVFSLTTGGAEKVLYSFGKGRYGGQPFASLIDVKGTLYGTTTRGGRYERGTVFSLTTGGTEKLLHSFGNGTDGVYPAASLVEVNGTLYGTTEYGGAYSCGSSGGCGTIFSITTNGTENVLHNFGSGSDGKSPRAALINVSGTLYGTTLTGGANGKGTVFALTP